MAYLLDRKQYVVYDQTTSEEGKIVCGVPQGSILGPFLFLLYIHTLRVHYAHATANLNSGHSKYAKVVRVHYFCAIALRTSHAVLTRA